MLALYREGRQADALAAYQDARAMLVDELGIEPGPGLRRLQHAILRQDPALDAAAPETRAGEVFVGREHEMEQLVAALDEAVTGRGSLCLIAGEPGAGKSRLAERAAEEGRARGMLTLAGRCWEAGGAPAYWPWVEALRDYLARVDEATAERQLGADRARDRPAPPRARRRGRQTRASIPTRRASGSSTPSAASSSPRRGSSRSSSCSRTCTPPTRRRCSCWSCSRCACAARGSPRSSTTATTRSRRAAPPRRP